MTGFGPRSSSQPRRSKRPTFSQTMKSLQPDPPHLAPYVRTLPIVIEAMLEAGGVTAEDRLYDLGCGDGRILITAAQTRGVCGVGVDIDLERIQDAQQQAVRSQVSEQVEFRCQDLLTVDLSQATVVTLYLLPESNLRIRDRLQQHLPQGARIISHSFDMGDWEPTLTTTVSDVINTYPIFVWTICR